ncbi:MAG: hypothetical protein OEM26_15920, partial [Saprospiraceae bacterium]|nr:hypothetical protein [Saprospiraceae bacterium]
MRKEDSVVQMEPEEMGQSLEELTDETSEASIPISPLPWWLLKASGTYVRSKFPKLAPAPLHESTNGVDKSDLPTEIGILPFYSDEIRLDIDGRYPQSTVSGV